MGTAEARRRKGGSAATDGGVAKGAAAVAPAASPKKRASSPTKKRAPPAAASKGGAERASRLRSLAYLAAVLAAAAAVWAAGKLRRPAGGGEPAVEPGAVNGHFPAGCTWREAFPKGKPGFWDVRSYEFWDAAAEAWTSTQPAACLVAGVPQPADAWPAEGPSPRTEANCTDNYCTFRNLWYNNGHFYLLTDGPDAVEAWKISRNQELVSLHVADARAFARSLSAHTIPGDTIVFDFVYFLHPTAIGHWSEMLFPLFSVLRLERAFARPPTQFVLLHLKRAHLMEWARAVLATALGVGPAQPLPPIMWQQEVDSVWKQILAPLEGFKRSEWLRFESVVAVKDTYTGGVRTFLSQQDARLFRRMVYAQFGLPPPSLRVPFPRTITFHRKSANRRVVNEAEMVAMLREFGEVRVVEFTAATPVSEQMAVIAGTGVFVSVHTSALANAQFLQPGSVILEIIQRNWVWQDLDESFKVQSEAMGDLHHFAWRARHRNATVYLNPRDEQRFGDWEGLACNTEECVEAHTNVDVVVDVPQLRALLADRLPLVAAGHSVADCALPWPERG